MSDILQDFIANRPEPRNFGRVFKAIDEGISYIDIGTDWIVLEESSITQITLQEYCPAFSIVSLDGRRCSSSIANQKILGLLLQEGNPGDFVKIFTRGKFTNNLFLFSQPTDYIYLNGYNLSNISDPLNIILLGVAISSNSFYFCSEPLTSKIVNNILSSFSPSNLSFLDRILTDGSQVLVGGGNVLWQ